MKRLAQKSAEINFYSEIGEKKTWFQSATVREKREVRRFEKRGTFNKFSRYPHYQIFYPSFKDNSSWDQKWFESPPGHIRYTRIYVTWVRLTVQPSWRFRLKLWPPKLRRLVLSGHSPLPRHLWACFSFKCARPNLCYIRNQVSKSQF